jgi:hypothetical protein
MTRVTLPLTCLLLAGVLATPAAAQRVRAGDVVSGVQFQGYDFDNELGVEAANLIMFPVAWQLSVGNRLGFDLYTAYARGAALIGGTEYTLAGPVDTRVRANYTAAPWAVLTFGLNLPTGATAHTENEARVAAVLATDLLGFREANFGLGFGATTGIATAYRVGDTGIGFGASYRLASEFEPRADTALKYTPGNEVRIRAGVDHNFGSGKVTAGVTYQNFARDRLDGRDLFQAGSRVRADAAYSFRTGPAASWTAYLTDVWRNNGDLSLDALQAGESGTLRTGSQNLLITGVSGSWRMRPALSVLPLAEIRVLTREDPGGDGWLATAGASVPLRVRTFGVTPLARLSYGSIEDDAAVGRRIIGGELGLTVAWRPR